MDNEHETRQSLLILDVTIMKTENWDIQCLINQHTQIVTNMHNNTIIQHNQSVARILIIRPQILPEDKFWDTEIENIRTIFLITSKTP